MDGAVAQVHALTPSAERMRLSRDRRRKGLRCVLIELRETEIIALMRMGCLRAEERGDNGAVKKALYEFFERTLSKYAR